MSTVQSWIEDLLGMKRLSHSNGSCVSLFLYDIDGVTALFSNASPRPSVLNMLRDRLQTVMPAPISVKFGPDSYRSTAMSLFDPVYFFRTSARKSPPMPPPLFVQSVISAHKSTELGNSPNRNP